MAKFVTLVDFTEQGIRGYRDTRERAQAFKAKAAEHGVELRELFWTLGDHDGLLILEGDEQAVAALLLWLGSQGNVRTKTMRAFDSDEIGQILARP